MMCMVLVVVHVYDYCHMVDGMKTPIHIHTNTYTYHPIYTTLTHTNTCAQHVHTPTHHHRVMVWKARGDCCVNYLWRVKHMVCCVAQHTTPPQHHLLYNKHNTSHRVPPG